MISITCVGHVSRSEEDRIELYASKTKTMSEMKKIAKRLIAGGRSMMRVEEK